MSKTIRTGTIYRMVGVLVAAILALAIAVPKIAGSLIAQADTQDAEVAARPEANAPMAAPPKPAAMPQAPVVFGAPTMPAAPVDYAKLQQQGAQNSPAPASTAAPATAKPAPTYHQSAPAPSSDLGVDPNVTAPRVIPPQPQPRQQSAKPQSTGRRSAIQ